MSIRFKREGQEYIVDTPDEAARLAELFHHEDERRAKIEPAFAKKLALSKSGWTEERFWSVINGIGKEQTRFLVAIFYQQILDAEDLVYGLGLDSQVSLAGVVSGLSKQLEKLHVKPSEVYQVEQYWEGKKRRRFFRLASGFDVLAANLEWKNCYLVDDEIEEIQKRLDKTAKK